MQRFQFREYPAFTDGEIDVTVEKKVPGHRLRGLVPAYHFKITLHRQAEKIGRVDLRIGYMEKLVLYGGHIGYGIDEAFRGHGYAAKACNLIKQVAVDHHMDVLWITCNPDNVASRQTCENIGCEFIEIVDLPPDNDQYRRGERQKCRYRWIIYGGNTAI
ncbi:MAG TPA: GNAT family N-acetyltransferase [Candidatus Lokiarchaeia archaeon]|nr:GNAT family N-acetyltransferase [Candidatus Lokiarchaeia archaeon]